MRVLLAGGGTGGHLMPALALAQALRDARRDVEPVLVGAERGIEAQLFPHYPFRSYLLPLEPIYRAAWWRNLRWPLIAWRVGRAVAGVLEREAPALVIGTGGYVAGPVLWLAGRRGLPIILVEENAFPGLATRWLARRARQVHLGFPEAQARITVGRETEVFALGNPIRPPEPGERIEALRAFGLDPSRATVLVFGGSQGAKAINFALAGALERRLLEQVNVLWGTGAAHFPELERYAVPGRVVVRGFFDPMALAYRAADLVVSRAGAMTVAELCAWGKPSVLVPLPSAAADHQTFNARALAEAGAARWSSEREFSGYTLARTLAELLGDPSRLASMAARARERGRPKASREVVSRILTLVD